MHPHRYLIKKDWINGAEFGDMGMIYVKHSDKRCCKYCAAVPILPGFRARGRGHEVRPCGFQRVERPWIPSIPNRDHTPPITSLPRNSHIRVQRNRLGSDDKLPAIKMTMHRLAA